MFGMLGTSSFFKRIGFGIVAVFVMVDTHQKAFFFWHILQIIVMFDWHIQRSLGRITPRIDNGAKLSGLWIKFHQLKILGNETSLVYLWLFCKDIYLIANPIECTHRPGT